MCRRRGGAVEAVRAEATPCGSTRPGSRATRARRRERDAQGEDPESVGTDRPARGRSAPVTHVRNVREFLTLIRAFSQILRFESNL